MPEARTVLDIGGNILCPGFIDSHSHSDLRIIDEPLALPKIMQGITTENVGLDSMSVAPISDKNKESWSTSISGLDGVAQKPWGWNGFRLLSQCARRRETERQPELLCGARHRAPRRHGHGGQAAHRRRTAPYGRKRGPVHGGRRARHFGGAHLHAQQVPVHGRTRRARQSRGPLRRHPRRAYAQ